MAASAPSEFPPDPAIAAEWPLDPDIAYLNHGGYGATPRRVTAVQDEWRARIERNPTAFMSRDVIPSLRGAAAKVAAALGAEAADLVFVENATAGLNAVLRSLALRPGDEILITGLSYGAITQAVRFVAEASGARIVEVPLTLPIESAEAMVEAIAARFGPRLRLALFDHVASASAVLLPVAELTRRAKAAGAQVLIDGAHAPGQVPLDIPALGADWYVGNLHKWYFAPHGCGFLWAGKDAQQGLHPVAISHGLGQGFTTEFDWTGTRDFSPILAAPAGIDFHNGLGGPVLMTRNRALAQAAVKLMTDAWRSEPGAPAECFAALATVRLPLPGVVTPERALALRAWLAYRHRIEVALTAENGAFWLRFSAQAYNHLGQYERLAAAVTEDRGDRP